MNIKINDDITLAKRKNTSKWQAVIKDPTGKWRRISCKTEIQKEAEQFAFNKLAEWRVLTDRDIPITNKRTFKSVADAYEKKLKEDIELGRATKSHKNYLYSLNKYLVPFFGDKDIKNISYGDIDEFDSWRFDKLGREPAKSTMNKHNIIFRAVMDFAVKRGWIKKEHIPTLTVKGKGRKSIRRGHFEKHEFDEILQFLKKWPEQSNHYITQYKRKVLYRYFVFLGASGIRPGTEALSICWKDLQFAPKPCPTELLLEDGTEPIYIDRDGNEMPYGIFHVFKRKGKKATETEDNIAEKYSVLRNDVFYFLEQLKDLRSNEIEPDDLVFCMPDGSPIKDFTEMFRSVLEELGLRFGADGRVRTLYSLRHSYATWKLREGKLRYEQLKTQMDTSVAMLEAHYDHVVADHFAEDLLV
ncbi:MAG: phage integrase SAM-like domain-containing protein [Rhodospirillales bacterium]|nr:phage integrase SAM-like domain-containing protein [Rhodospirillales bacterium]